MEGGGGEGVRNGGLAKDSSCPSQSKDSFQVATRATRATRATSYQITRFTLLLFGCFLDVF